MNSPKDRSSPGLSESSSDEHEVGDDVTRAAAEATIEETAAYIASGSSIFSANKRRFPGTFVLGGSSARDPKSRRKGNTGIGMGGLWEGSMNMASRSHKDDMVDVQLVEQLRHQFGDPFDDSILKNASGGSN